jgi:hypothetical protein
MRDWRRALRRMSVDLNETWSPAVDSPGDGFVDDALRHHCGNIAASEVPGLLLDWLRRTEDAVECLVRSDPSGHARATQTLDSVREEFDWNAATFGAADEPRHIERIETAAAQGATSRDAVARVEWLVLERQRLVDEGNRLSLERDAAAAECNRFDTEVRALTTALDASRSELSALRSSMSWRVTAPLRAACRLLVGQ